MEVMNSFELDWTIISLSYHENIIFQMFGVEYLILYTEFFVVMGLIDVEYTCTKSYSQLHVDLPVHLSPDQVWILTLWGRETYICCTSKVSTLRCVAFKYLHTVLLTTLTGREDNTRSSTSLICTSSRAWWLENWFISAMPLPSNCITNLKIPGWQPSFLLLTSPNLHGVWAWLIAGWVCG